MNRIYRLIWNAVTGTWTCAPEFARGRGKASVVRGTLRHTLRRFLIGISAVSLASYVPLGSANGPVPNQLPEGGRVVAGQATIQQPGPATLDIHQSSNRAAIDWQTFNIGAAGTVNFLQPSAQSVTLNRVLDANPSQIFGRLNANGQVFLTNPNGVFFAPGASVDVGGLVATTHGISNEDFMSGRDVFTRNGALGKVVNVGQLTAASGGYVALLAPEVRNEGVIVAQAGTVALAAGEAITLTFSPTSGLANIAVTPAQIKTLVDNRHAILAEGGQILLAARAADKLMASVVNSGELAANSMVARGGRIVIEANDISLTASSRIEAKGATGGGTVLVGGDAKGSGAMHRATTVTMAQGATIDASATQSGQGGTVVLWSEAHKSGTVTVARGTIAAKGGAAGGDGGFVETSGSVVDFNGIRVDTSAAQGATGTWLTDPFDLTVDSSAASTISANLATTNVTLQTTASGSTGPGTPNAAGSGDIIINAAIGTAGNTGWGSANTLTLDAYRNINVNAPISAGNQGKVVMITGDTAGTGVSGSATGDYSFGLGASGFAGNLTFGTAVGTATLSIAQGGGNAAPSAYTLIYDTGTGTNGFRSLNGGTGRYALANTLSLSGLGTVTSSVNATFGTSSNHAPVFTGLGNTVTGLTLTATQNSASTGNGLFGTNFAIIRDVGVGGATVSASTGTQNTGIMAGLSPGATYRNVWTSGTVSIPSAAGFWVGGLAGQLNNGSVTNSYSTATLSVNSASRLGGLIGEMTSSSISNSYATGALTSNTGSGWSGGLVGIMRGPGSSITNSYATGNVAGGAQVGGLVANMTGGTNTVTNSYATGNVSGASSVGGLVGNIDGTATLTGTYATGSVSGTTIQIGGLVGVITASTTISNSYAIGNVSSASTSDGRVGGLIGETSGTNTINTSFATGTATGFAYAGGLVGLTRTGTTIADAYAQGAVTGNNNVGGLLGYVEVNAITNVYASGRVSASGSTPSAIGGLMGTVGGTTITNGYWDSSSTGTNQASGYGAGAKTLVGGGALTTAQLQGAMPTGFNSGTLNGTPWGRTAGFYPYFTFLYPNNAQGISGHAYGANGSPAATGTVTLYVNGVPLAGGQRPTDSTGLYTALVDSGSVTTSSPLGGTLMLSGSSTVVGATYTNSPTLTSGNVLGFDIYSGFVSTYTGSTTLSGTGAGDPAAAFGASLYASAVQPITGQGWFASSAFDVDQAATTGLLVVAPGAITLGTAQTLPGNLTLKTTGAGGINVNAGITSPGGRTIIFDSYDNISFNANIALTNTDNAIIATGDTLGNLTSASAVGDYSFNLGPTGFGGRMTFGTSASTATLNIATGGTGAASPYTLKYNLSGITGVNGNYALAQGLSSLSGTQVASLTASSNFTGLGNSVAGLTLTAGGLFGTVAGTVRDIGVTGVSATSGSTMGAIAGTLTGTLKNDYSTGSLTGSATVGGLVGTMTAATIRNSWSSVVTSAPSKTGGLLGEMLGGTLDSVYAAGAVTSSSGNFAGGLVGFVSSATSASINNSYATGNVTGLANVGGLVGIANSGSALTVTNSYATGTMSGGGNVGGLFGSTNGTTNVTDSHATGAVNNSSTASGGLVGLVVGGTLNLTRTYALGNVTSASSGVGGLVGNGASGTTTINASFATGNVQGTTNVGGLIGSSAASTVINDAYANGSATGTAASAIVGGLIGTSGAATLTNVYASGAVNATGGGTPVRGGLVGTATGVKVTNGYWDNQATGLSAGYGTTTGTITGGGGLSTATLTNGTLPTGFNTAITSNNNPWNVTAGFYPYFSYQYAGGAQAISGTAYTSAGAAAAAATINLYVGGNLLSGGTRTTNSSGAYTALVGASTVTSSTPLGGTLTLNGAGAISGATYADNITLVSGNVTGFDLKSGMFLVTTSDISNSALQSNLSSTYGGATYTSLKATLDAALWQVNAGGNFSVDTALSHGGATGLTAVGNLSLDAAVAATGNLTLQGGGTLADGAAGSVSATNLVLLGGNVVLDNASNNVATLAAIGVSSLSYADANALSVGSIGPYTTGIAATTINGSSTTTTGISAAGDIAVSTASGNLTVSSNIGTTAGAADSTLTLKAADNLTLNPGVGISTASANKLNTVLWGDSDNSGSGTITVGSVPSLVPGSPPATTTINTNGGQLWVGGGAATSGTGAFAGLTVGNGYATNTGVTTGDLYGVGIGYASISTGAGSIHLAGKNAAATAPATTQYGIRMLNSSLATTSGDLTIDGQNDGLIASGGGAFIYANNGNAALTTTSGSISVKGTATDAGGATGQHIALYLQAFTAGRSLSIQSDTGNILIEGQGNFANNGTNASTALMVQAQTTTSPVSIASNAGDVTLRGALSSDNSNSAHNAISLRSADAAGNFTIGNVNATGAVNILGDTIQQVLTNAGAGAIAVLGEGPATVAPTSSSFVGLRQGASTMTFDDDWNFGNQHSAVTIGSATNALNLTLSNALTTAGAINVLGGDISVAALTAATDISLKSSGTIAQTGALTAAGLDVIGGNATLTNTSNNVASLAATGVGNLSYVDANALTIGTVGATSGIAATGTISVATLTGDLGLMQGVSTTDATASAITLNAGQSSAAGTATGGNIVVSGSPTVSTGAGGRATLYSGSATGDATLGALIGSGSGHFRYNSDEATTNYTTALGIGSYGIYREAVATNFSISNVSSAYGTTPSLTSSSGLVNGDAATVAVTGAQFSTSGNVKVGSYGIDVTNLADLTALGYTATGGTSGTLTVTPASLTVGGITADSRTYDGTTTATVSTGGATLTGLVSGDVVTVSATGAFNDKNVGAGKAVTLSSSYGGADAGNYSIADQASATASITLAALTVTATQVTKTYDGTTSATGSATVGTLAGAGAGETIGTAATQAFADRNAGIGNKTVHASGLVIRDSGNADVTSNYNITYVANNTSTINRAAITLGTANASKTYDGTVAAPGAAAAVVSGTLGSGDTLSGGSFAYTDKNVGAGNKTVTVAGIAIDDGNSGSNYTVAYRDNTASTITPAALSVSGLTANNRAYDGTTIATVDSGSVAYTGLVGGDAVSVSAIGSFANRHVGTGKTVTLSSSYGGADVGNYTIADQASATADISAAAITISSANVSKTYDGTTSAPGASAVLTSGTLFGVDAMSGGSFAFADKNVGAGNKTVTVAGVTVSDGNGGNNYSVTLADNTTSTITPAALAISGLTVANRTYDGTANATVNVGSAVYTGLISGDSVSVAATGTFANKHVGTAKSVTLASSYNGGDVGNYTITSQASTTASITAAAITLSTDNVSKTYDGTTTATGAAPTVASGTLFAGDTLSSGSFAFADKNVGLGNKTVTVSGITVADGNGGSNYSVTLADNTTSTITAAALSISGITAANKEYDRTTAATVSTATAVYTGLAVGDAVAVSATGTFADKNVGPGKTVMLASSYSGADAGNYTITDQATTTADITPKALTVGGITAADKVYDGNVTATVSTGAAIFSGLIGGDTVTVSATGSFAGKAVGTAKTVALSSSYGGADVGNYAITGQASTIANIIPASLTIGGITAADKVYDGNANAAVSTGGATYTGLVSGDAVTVSATGAFVNKNAGTGKTVNLASSYSGADVGNYTIADQTSTTADITPKALTIGGITAADKVYDGNTAATVSTAAATYAGLIGGDAVTVSASGAFADKDAGTAKTVTLANSYVGADVGNYSITDQAGTTADITPASLTITANADARFVTQADTTNFAGVQYAGFVAGETAATALDTSGLAVTRPNAGTDVAAGTYAGALVPAGATAVNYTITYAKIVDDTPENLALMNGLLKDEYRTRVASSGDRALKIAAAPPHPDLILLDIMMPGMDGFEVCRKLNADAATRSIPIIFLTAKSEVEDEQKGFGMGAVDYITKPISPPIVIARVRTHLALKAAADFLRDQNAYLESEVGRRTRELQVVQDVTIMAMASLAETRDNETGNHIRRTQNYVRTLALELRTDPKYAPQLDDATVELLYKSAPLHDIGKVGIPDAILLKPGKLTLEEFDIMKTHTTVGRDAILAAERLIEAPSSFLRHARDIAHYHQEKWDGSGYPEGLAGEAIPLSARLMAVAEVYDALISRRVYKPPYPHERAVAMMLEGRGSHFDPAILDAFLLISEQFRAIAEKFADTDADVREKSAAL